jgi:tetratricopeptide (TPR) repeat protein
MNSANYTGLALCPAIGFALLLGAVIWLFIRSPKAGAIGVGVLALCVLAGLALLNVRVQVNPSESPVACATPWWGIGARLRFLLVGAMFVGLMGLIVWGFARNPKKGFAAAAGVFVGLVLLAIFTLVAAILLPAFARARQVAGRNRLTAAPAATAPLRSEVPRTAASPTGDARLRGNEASVAETGRQPASGVLQMGKTTRTLYALGMLLLMVVLAHAFLAAGRYAFFKWPVRILAVAAFGVLCVIAIRSSGGFFAAGGSRGAQAALSRAVAAFRPAPALADRLIALARTSADDVATAVATAEAADIDDAQLKPLDLLVCGEYRLLGGDAEGAARAIEAAIRRGGGENWYQKSLGLALLHAGQPAEAKRVFEKAAGNADAWKRRPIINASLDAWTAAYFLDLVSEAEYTNNQAKDPSYACFPWFYIGQRMEIEGDRGKAIAAYRKSVELGEQLGAHYIRHWSAYRLRMLTEAARTPASRRVSETSSSRPAEHVEAPAGVRQEETR